MVIIYYLIMKRKLYCAMTTLAMLMTSLCIAGCGNEDNVVSNDASPTASIYGEWWLVGWNDGGEWLEVDTNYVSHQHLSIEIPEEGVVKAYSIANEAILGMMTVNGNELFFSDGRGITQMACDIEESLLFEKHIFGIKSYQQDGSLLRLYYSDEDYFVFTRDFDDSEAHLYGWKKLVAGPYIGEVVSVSSDEVEVKIVHHPSSTFGYSRNYPPSVNNLCHIAASDLSGLSFTTGDRIAFQVEQFRRLKVENGRAYECKVKPCDGPEHISNTPGVVHFDTYRKEWCIIVFTNEDKSAADFYFPMTPLPESLLTENQPVVFSGALYPAWIPTSGLSYHAESCYFVNIESLL